MARVTQTLIDNGTGRQTGAGSQTAYQESRRQNNSNTSTGTSYSRGSAAVSDGGGYHDYFADLLAQFEKESKAARDAAIAAIMKNLEATKGTYNNQIEEVKGQYGRLIDENEVKKYQARRVIRENQANRGQLDSGLGRQEQLNMNVGYDKQTSNLNSSRTRAVNDIMNLITQAEAEAENQKANIMSNYANQLLQFKLMHM